MHDHLPPPLARAAGICLKTTSLPLVGALLLFLALNPSAMGAQTVADLPVPQGYQRLTFPEESYSRYLQQLPLKPDKTIARYDGKPVPTGLYRVLAVVDRPLLFRSDLEQCADLCMRFWADFHRDRGRTDTLFLYDYNGRKKYFRDSGRSFQDFLKWHMAYSNSFSLKQGANAMDARLLRPGDMFVQNTDGGIGHVSLVVDAAANSQGQRVYLIGFGFIPAQEFHIEQAGSSHGVQGWFTLEGYQRYLAGFPFGRYGRPVMRRFEP